MANKVCTKCKQTKPLTDFYKAHYNYKTNQDGHDYYCKYCRKGTHLRSMENNKKICSIDDCDKPNYAKQMCRMHYARVDRNGTAERKIRIVKDGIYRSNGLVVSSRRSRLNRIYKISIEEYESRAMHGCEICGDKPEANLHVDHNHKCCPGPKSCGQCVRGIVCNRCNQAIDKMEDGIMRGDYPNYGLIKKYLEEYSG